MSSEAMSEQQCVHEGAGYNEVYLSSHGDKGSTTLLLEREPSTNPPSEEEEEDGDDEEQGLNGDDSGSDGEESDKSVYRTVVNPNGLRNFVLPPLWTVNDFIRP